LIESKKQVLLYRVDDRVESVEGQTKFDFACRQKKRVSEADPLSWEETRASKKLAVCLVSFQSFMYRHLRAAGAAFDERFFADFGF
jgi:hypothetical protein